MECVPYGYTFSESRDEDGSEGISGTARRTRRGPRARDRHQPRPRVGTFIPSQWVRDAVAAEKAAASVARWRREMKARGINLEAELAAMGLSTLGEPLDVQAGR